MERILSPCLFLLIFIWKLVTSLFFLLIFIFVTSLFSLLIFILCPCLFLIIFICVTSSCNKQQKRFSTERSKHFPTGRKTWEKPGRKTGEKTQEKNRQSCCSAQMVLVGKAFGCDIVPWWSWVQFCPGWAIKFLRCKPFGSDIVPLWGAQFCEQSNSYFAMDHSALHAIVLYFQQLEQKRWRMDELWTFKLEMSKSEEPGQMIFSPLYWLPKRCRFLPACLRFNLFAPLSLSIYVSASLYVWPILGLEAWDLWPWWIRILANFFFTRNISIYFWYPFQLHQDSDLGKKEKPRRKEKLFCQKSSFISILSFCSNYFHLPSALLNNQPSPPSGFNTAFFATFANIANIAVQILKKNCQYIQVTLVHWTQSHILTLCSLTKTEVFLFLEG